jgi:hypothetical protein
MLTLVTYGILQVTTTFSPSSSPSNIHHTFFILLLILNQYCFLTLHLFAISIYHNYRINACTYIPNFQYIILIHETFISIVFRVYIHLFLVI